MKLGAIDENANLTPLGKEMAVLPTETIYSKLLMVSLKPEYQTVSKQVTSIVAMLSVENIFYNPLGGQDIESKILKKRIKLFNP
jgi:HrpA-like RNA helicase